MLQTWILKKIQAINEDIFEYITAKPNVDPTNKTQNNY